MSLFNFVAAAFCSFAASSCSLFFVLARHCFWARFCSVAVCCFLCCLLFACLRTSSFFWICRRFCSPCFVCCGGLFFCTSRFFSACPTSLFSICHNFLSPCHSVLRYISIIRRQTNSYAYFCLVDNGWF